MKEVVLQDEKGNNMTMLDIEHYPFLPLGQPAAPAPSGPAVPDAPDGVLAKLAVMQTAHDDMFQRLTELVAQTEMSLEAKMVHLIGMTEKLVKDASARVPVQASADAGSSGTTSADPVTPTPASRSAKARGKAKMTDNTAE